MTDVSSTASDDLRAILGAGLSVVDPARLVAGSLADEPVLQEWAGAVAAAPPPRAAGTSGTGAGRPRLALLSVGKAGVGMARGAIHLLGDLVDAGLVLIPHGYGERPTWLPPQIEFHTGGHPLPDRDGVAAARAAAELVDGLAARDHLLVLLSGGTSALLTLPVPGVAVDDVAEATRYLMEEGMAIHDLNRVRGTLDQLKHGGLARRAGPARTLGLVLSDVAGDDLGTIGSGPLTPRSEGGRAVEILLRRRKLWDGLPGAVRQAIARHEPGGAGAGEVTLRLIGGGESALAGAAREARRRGYHVTILSHDLQGEARTVGAGLARAAMAVQDGVVEGRRPACLLAAGETTVTVRGDGRGGPNQEVALGAALRLEGRRDIRVASLGTDGVDGPTDAAGALVDGSTAARARAAGLDPAAALERNDAYALLDRVGALIRTGPTGTNVADLMVALVTS